MGELGLEIDHEMEETFSIHGILDFGRERCATEEGGKVWERRMVRCICCQTRASN